MTLKRVSAPSPNYSSRGGAHVSLIVVHTAQGATTASDLAAFFANPGSGVSSHVGVDDTANTVWEYVRRDYKAWCQSNFNPQATCAETCAFAEWDTATWNTHPNMLANTAAWIAEEAAYFDIPIRKLTAAQAQGGTPGVCGHVDLGAGGGGHWDPGPGFPWDAVLALAGGVTATPPATPAPTPKPPPGGAPPWPGRYLAYPPLMQGTDVHDWQKQMAKRGWPIVADGAYGPDSERVCVDFQTEKGLTADGIVGPDTWAAAWTAPVT